MLPDRPLPSPRPERPLAFTGPDGLVLRGFVWEPTAPPPTGAPALPPLVFSPGNGFCVQAYRPMLAELPAHVAVHALNLRGHGGSDVPPQAEGAASWDGLVADLRAYVEQRLGGRALLAGHSMGAMISLRLASEAPPLAAGLLLLEPPLRLRRGESLPPEAVVPRRAFIERARNRRAEWPSRAEAAAWFEGSVGFRLWHPAARAGLVEAGLVDTPAGGVALACPPWLEVGFYETVPQQELYAWADATRCAAVLYRGLDSPVLTVPAYEALAEALPVGVVLPVPGTHAFPMEHPRETGQRLAEGLRLLAGETGLAATAAAPAHTQ